MHMMQYFSVIFRIFIFAPRMCVASWWLSARMPSYTHVISLSGTCVARFLRKGEAMCASSLKFACSRVAAASIRMRQRWCARSPETPRRPWARYQIFIMHLSALEEHGERLFINNSIKSNNSHAYEVRGVNARKIDGAATVWHARGSKLKVSRRFGRWPN